MSDKLCDPIINFLSDDNLSDKFDKKTYEYFLQKSNREYWLIDEIEEENDTIDLVKSIIQWNREDKDIPVEKRKPIIIYIYSVGGDLDICRSIIDAISTSKTPIYGVNIGKAFSASAYIFISCHKRFILKSSSFIFHQGSASYYDVPKDEKDLLDKDYNKKIADLTTLMIEKTKFPEKIIKKKIKTEWYVYADEALENGVCDRIIENIDEIFI